MGVLKPDVLKCPHILTCLGLQGKKSVWKIITLSQR